MRWFRLEKQSGDGFLAECKRMLELFSERLEQQILSNYGLLISYADGEAVDAGVYRCEVGLRKDDYHSAWLRVSIEVEKLGEGGRAVRAVFSINFPKGRINNVVRLMNGYSSDGECEFTVEDSPQRRWYVRAAEQLVNRFAQFINNTAPCAKHIMGALALDDEYIGNCINSAMRKFILTLSEVARRYGGDVTVPVEGAKYECNRYERGGFFVRCSHVALSNGARIHFSISALINISIQIGCSEAAQRETVVGTLVCTATNATLQVGDTLKELFNTSQTLTVRMHDFASYDDLLVHIARWLADLLSTQALIVWQSIVRAAKGDIAE